MFLWVLRAFAVLFRIHLGVFARSAFAGRAVAGFVDRLAFCRIGAGIANAIASAGARVRLGFLLRARLAFASRASAGRLAGPRSSGQFLRRVAVETSKARAKTLVRIGRQF